MFLKFSVCKHLSSVSNELPQPKFGAEQKAEKQNNNQKRKKQTKKLGARSMHVL